MQGMTDIKVPPNYEPKTPDEFGTFDRAMTRLMSVPASEIQRRIVKHRRKKERKKRAKKPASRASGEA
jgi:hypothetical protein